MSSPPVDGNTRLDFETEDSLNSLFLIKNMADAEEKARACAAEGFGVIELCGAFGQSGAEALIAATGGKLGIGYGVHLPGQDGLFAAFFAH